MAIRTVYNRDGSIYGELETNNFVFNNNHITSEPKIFDVNLYPYVKINGEFYRNDGGEWYSIAKGNTSATLMSISNSFLSKNEQISFWMDSTEEKNSDISKILNKIDFNFSSIFHYYSIPGYCVKDKNIRVFGAKKNFEKNKKSNLKFKKELEYTPLLKGKDIFKFNSTKRPYQFYNIFGESEKENQVITNIEIKKDQNKLILTEYYNDRLDNYNTFSISLQEGDEIIAYIRQPIKQQEIYPYVNKNKSTFERKCDWAFTGSLKEITCYDDETTCVISSLNPVEVYDVTNYNYVVLENPTNNYDAIYKLYTKENEEDLYKEIDINKKIQNSLYNEIIKTETNQIYTLNNSSIDWYESENMQLTLKYKDNNRKLIFESFEYVPNAIKDNSQIVASSSLQSWGHSSWNTLFGSNFWDCSGYISYWDIGLSYGAIDRNTIFETWKLNETHTPNLGLNNKKGGTVSLNYERDEYNFIYDAHSSLHFWIDYYFGYAIHSVISSGYSFNTLFNGKLNTNDLRERKVDNLPAFAIFIWRNATSEEN